VSETKRVPVLVTTEHRGVFFGWRAPGNVVLLHPADSKAITLTDAQMCVAWSGDVQGVLGLAATGPDRRSKVTRPVPELTVTEVTAVVTATQEAVTAWQARPWS
jgi:phage-related protein